MLDRPAGCVGGMLEWRGPSVRAGRSEGAPTMAVGLGLDGGPAGGWARAPGATVVVANSARTARASGAVAARARLGQIRMPLLSCTCQARLEPLGFATMRVAGAPTMTIRFRSWGRS